MTHADQVAQLARAIKRAAEAHGADGNHFTAGELCAEYGAPWSLVTGRLLRKNIDEVSAAAGYVLTYKPGRPCQLSIGAARR